MNNPPTITARAEPVPRHEEPLEQAAFCALCPKLCRPACPVSSATGREAVAPWRISDAIVGAGANGWTVALATQAASCTGCLACAQPCLPGTNLPELSRAARAAAFAAGAPLPAAVSIRNRVAAAASPRRDPQPGCDLTGVVLWGGCPADGTETADAAAALMAAAGESPSREATGDCCGAVALDLGLPDEARVLATRAAARLAGAERVVVVSPSCARMMREEWPHLGLEPPPVTTAVEWLQGALPSLPLAPASGPVAWHAPCTLTRALGVVEEGPAILRSLGHEPRGPVTACSGAGAAYPLVDPDGARRVAGACRASLDALGAPAVTACPSAARALGATDLLVLAAGRLAR